MDLLCKKQLYVKKVKKLYSLSILFVTYYLVEIGYHQEKESILLQFKLYPPKKPPHQKENKQTNKKQTQNKTKQNNIKITPKYNATLVLAS